MKLITWINKGIVYVRITINGRRAELSTGIKAPIKSNDSVSQLKLSEILFKIRKEHLILSMSGEDFDALDIKQAYENSQPKAPKVYRILDVMADKDRIYRATTSKLKAFLGKKNPKLKDLDQNFIEGFARYLEKSLSPSSVKIYLSKVFASISPFMDEMNFKMPEIKVEIDETPKYLTLSQFEALKQLDLDDRFYLDCFIFQCISGMSMVDLNNFDGKLDTMISGDRFIRYHRAKTGVEGIVPVSKEMENYLKMFPVKLTERSYNKNLKKIGEKIDYKNMTSHCARHTFGVLKLIEGYSMESCSKMLGHSSISLTERIYAKVTLTKLFKEQRLISNN